MSVLLGLLAIVVFLLVLFVYWLSLRVESSLSGLLADLLCLLGFYVSLCGILSHFVGRRQIAQSVNSDRIRIEGDLTSLIGFTICTLVWCMLQSVTHLWTRLGSAILILLTDDEAWNQSAAGSLDVSILCSIAVVSLLYVVISGPPVARLLVPAALLIVPGLLLFSAILVSREEARKGMAQYRLGNMGKAIIKRRQDHRDTSPFDLRSD